MSSLIRTSFISIGVIWFSSFGYAASSVSNQPYIDKVKRSLEPAPAAEEGNQPFIDSIRHKLPIDPKKDESYIEKLKKQDAERNKPQPAESYLETEKRRLEKKETDDRPSPIDTVKQGKSSALELKRPGAIHWAAGARVGINNTRNITANAESKDRNFSDIYPDKWVPDVTVFGEYQPFHSEWFGNVGIIGSAGYSQFKGAGKFAIDDLSYSTTSFGSDSKTEFRFNVIPVEIGAIYRFNLLRILRPYVRGSAVGLAYFETRSDNKDGHKGKSTGVSGSVGVAILLDFLSNSTAWDVYSEQGVKHSYLTVEYTRVKSTSGNVRFNSSGVYSGMTFEF